MAKDESVIVLTETTSNVQQPQFFTRIDTLLVLLRKMTIKKTVRGATARYSANFGGMIVSKKIKAFLRNYNPKQHWHVDPKKAYSTFLR